MKKRAFIIPTTHWDREWVMTRGQFQIRLANMLDHVLDMLGRYPDYVFVSDGQAIMLEDYLEVCPENKARMEKYLREGRFVAGPWYVLADQFLEDGESAIRNLYMGQRIVEKLGGHPMQVGYVPDSFGSVSSLPMILAGFGIRYAMFGRGRPYWNESLSKYEFIWQGADGSEIITSNHGYGNGYGIAYPNGWKDGSSSFEKPDFEKALANFLNEARARVRGCATPNAYLAAGVDHMIQNEYIMHTVDYIRENQDEFEVLCTSPERYMEAVGSSGVPMQKYRGEMRGNSAHPMDLVGTLSSRIYQKQYNEKCSRTLAKVAEPLCVMANRLTGQKYPAGLLEKLWMLLLQNHPHDSICGCSRDEVHREMQSRFEQISHTSEYLIKDLVQNISSNIRFDFDGDTAAAVITVFNPTENTADFPVDVLITVPKRLDGNYIVRSMDGKTLSSAVEIVARREKDFESAFMTPKYLCEIVSKADRGILPDSEILTVAHVDFVAGQVPSFGYKSYYLCAGIPLRKTGDCGCMENAYVRVTPNANGTLDITDKKNGRVYSNLNYFTDREDTGDTYDHHSFSVPDDYDSRECAWEWTLTEHFAHKTTYVGKTAWLLPECLNGKTRSENKKAVGLTQKVTLYSHSPVVSVTLEFDNVCRDHCLRAVFASRGENTVSSGHFDVLSRPVSTAFFGEWRDNPFADFVDLGGVCLFAKGLMAYEAFSDCLTLTLLRSVGTIGVAAGANHIAPEAQCQGKQKFEYAIFIHADTWEKDGCLEESVIYRTECPVSGDVAHDGTLSQEVSLLSVNGYVSCLKKAFESDDTVLRVWNAYESRLMELKLHFDGGKTSHISPAMLNEKPLDGKCDTLSAKSLHTVMIG